MTTDEAYQRTMDAVLDLKSSGIEVNIVPSGAREREEMVQKYSGPERVSSDKWVHVHFVGVDKEQSQRIHDAAMLLSRDGISFDTGGGCGGRDWELDWSFSYTGRHDPVLDAARDTVEDLIEGGVVPGDDPEGLPA
jgi:hypothetical protein